MRRGATDCDILVTEEDEGDGHTGVGNARNSIILSRIRMGSEESAASDIQLQAKQGQAEH